jgi:uncharacterized protein
VSPERVRGYAEFLVNRRGWVVLVSALVAVVGLLLAKTLPVRTDATALLPPQVRSVLDLRAIEKRVRAAGTLMILLQAPTPAQREAAAKALEPHLDKLPKHRISEIIAGDGEARSYFWDNRFLFVSLSDLQAARDAVADRIQRAKLAANPAYVSFEDDGDAAGPNPVEQDLRRRLADAESRANANPLFISKDGKTQLWIVRTPSGAVEVSGGTELVKYLDAVGEIVEKQHGVEIGLTGDILTGVTEQRAILGGMMKATIITVLLVGFGLWLYFRSGLAALALLAALSVGVLATFGVTVFTVGHLNSVSAFLAAIVVGVGIDFGIILLARFLEEKRRGLEGAAAMAAALSGSIHGTVAAAVATGVAYASLIVTDFRGFREFGVIGGIGMALCWLASVTTLPALIAMLEHAGKLPMRKRDPAIGRLLGALLPRRRMPTVAALAMLATVVCGGIAWRYLEGNPFEYDWRNLRSTGADAAETRRLMDIIDKQFGRDVSGAFVIAAETRADGNAIAKTLRAVDAGLPPEQRQFGAVTVYDDLIPKDQEAKLQVLAEIRTLLDDDALAALTPEERADVARLRPPDSLRVIGDADVPQRLTSLFQEKGGERGRLVFVNYGGGVDDWDGHALAGFSDSLRNMDFPDGALLGGTAFVFTDIMRAVEHDGVRATLVAMIGVTLFVFLVVGWSRHAAATLLATLVGLFGMIAGCWAFGVKVNFLDFVALPLVLGIGVDYAANVALRDREEGDDDSETLRSLTGTGGAVVLCSYTTIIGYGSLILSDNAGIRSFGLAATLGEIACLVAALTVVPVVLHYWRRRPVLQAARS